MRLTLMEICIISQTEIRVSYKDKFINTVQSNNSSFCVTQLNLCILYRQIGY
jgi:hypothetical protein